MDENIEINKKTIRKKNIDLTIPILLFLICIYINKNKCLLFLDKNVCKYDIIFISSLMIFIYGYMNIDINRDVLITYKFFDCKDCDIWLLSHVILYFILGYVYPNHYLFWLIAGYIWELFEHYNGIHNINILGYKLNRNSKNQWWYGRLSDIAANMTGYILGNYVHNNYHLWFK